MTEAPARLEPLPGSFAATRDALHRVAEELVAPARKPQNEIALRQTTGGFGTPPFEFEGKRMQVRVRGTELVLESDGADRSVALSSLADGGAFLGPKLLPDGVPDDATPLDIDAAAAARLADVYALAASVLESFSSGLPDAAEASPISLWPEHFDIAVEAGSESAGERANYGVSPGDEDHPEPYVYVGPWTAKPDGELWNAAGFPGAELAYADLVGIDDPAAVALGFVQARYDALTQTGE